MTMPTCALCGDVLTEDDAGRLQHTTVRALHAAQPSAITDHHTTYSAASFRLLLEQITILQEQITALRAALDAADPSPPDTRLERLVGEVATVRAVLRRAGCLRSIVDDADAILSAALADVEEARYA